ncbi:hypothetical protein Tco_0037501, partial [Tanacetum coccineum]
RSASQDEELELCYLYQAVERKAEHSDISKPTPFQTFSIRVKRRLQKEFRVAPSSSSRYALWLNLWETLDAGEGAGTSSMNSFAWILRKILPATSENTRPELDADLAVWFIISYKYGL